MNRITIAKGLTGLAVFGAALAAGAVAQAQPAAAANGYYYDPSRRLFGDAESGRWFRHVGDGRYEQVA